MLTTFEGKTAVITGGATGIGRALASVLASKRMNIVLASTNPDRLEQAASELRKQGAKVLCVPCDVADRSAVRELATRTIEAFGSVQLLCANAGVTTSGPFLDHRDEDWDWVYDVVLRGVTNCIQAFYPVMAKAGEGQIMITGSQAGLLPDWTLGHGPYTSAKAAVTALGVALRPEAAEHGVGVTVMIPAATESDILQSSRTRPERFGGAAARQTLHNELAMREGAPPPSDASKFYMTAAEVAEIVVSKLPENPAFIATHACMKPVVEEYFERILAAY